MANDEEIRETQTTDFGKVFRNLSQGNNKTGMPSINATHVIDLEQIIIQSTYLSMQGQPWILDYRKVS